MIVTCRNCNTKFNLPDTVNPGAKVRCSVCKYVFPLPPDAKDSAGSIGDTFDRSSSRMDMGDLGEKPKKKRSWMGLFVLLFLCLLGGGGAVLWFYTPYLDSFKVALAPPPKPDTTELVRLIALRGVRQYNINNEKIGNISVVEGKAVNGFPEPRELVRVEAALYDPSGNVLVSKQQLAGTSVSLFQLQVLGEKELEQALANKIDILTNNTNVEPGNEVPFMVVFYTPPDNAAEFGVKVIDAKLPAAK